MEVEMEATEADMPDLTKIQQTVAEMMSRYDKNKDEKLSLTEFAEAVSDNPGLLSTVVNMRYYFQLADRNGDQQIDRNELQNLIRLVVADAGRPPLSDEEVSWHTDAVFAVADTNKDGFIDFQEFSQYTCRTSEDGENSFLNLLACKLWSSKPGEDGDIGQFVKKAVVQSPEFKARLDRTHGDASLPPSKCCQCSVPLIGKQGITKFGRDFCSMRCSDAFSRTQEGRDERDAHNRKYYGTTKNIKDDKKVHGQVASWRKEYFEGKRSFESLL